MGLSFVLAPAEEVGVPAFAQVQQPAVAKKESSRKEKTGAEPTGKKPRGPRRKMGDIWPFPRGNEVEDVQRLWEWVRRGSYKPHQRMIDFRGQRIDIDDAWKVLKKEGKRRVTSRPHQMATVTAPKMPAYLPAHPQQFGAPVFFPTTSPAYTHAIPYGVDFHLSTLPNQPIGFQTPSFTHPGLLPPQHMGSQASLSFPPTQATMPARQPTPALPQQSGNLLVEEGGINAAIQSPGCAPVDPTMGNFSFAAGHSGCQGDLSYGLNGAVQWVGDPEAGELDLLPITPEEAESIRRIVAEMQSFGGGAEGLQPQSNVSDQDVDEGSQASMSVTGAQQHAGDVGTGEPLDDLSGLT